MVEKTKGLYSSQKTVLMINNQKKAVTKNLQRLKNTVDYNEGDNGTKIAAVFESGLKLILSFY